VVVTPGHEPADRQLAVVTTFFLTYAGAWQLATGGDPPDVE
jgi:hypothetical protein